MLNIACCALQASDAKYVIVVKNQKVPFSFADAGAVYSPPNRHCEIVRFERQIKKGRSEANRQHLYYRTCIARG